MGRRIHLNTSPTLCYTSMVISSQQNISQNQKIIQESRLHHCHQFYLKEETFIKKTPCSTVFRRELFAKIFTAKKLQNFINKKLVTWSCVLRR